MIRANECIILDRIQLDIQALAGEIDMAPGVSLELAERVEDAANELLSISDGISRDYVANRDP